MTIKNIIFDLGGVILNIDFAKTVKAFHNLGINGFAPLTTKFQNTSLFEDYERGKINDADFVRAIQTLSKKPLAEEAVIKAWNALLLDFPAERIELLWKLKKKYRLFLLSNTNALHLIEFQKRFHSLTGVYLEEIFEKTYYSHLLGMSKPQEEIFRLVIEENNLVPSETLFIDDTADNFKGSEKLGIISCHLAPPKSILDLKL